MYKTLGYYNGTIDEIDRVFVPMNDRGGYFGDGVYDATACYNRRLFLLDEHLERFFASAQGIGIALPFTKDWLKAELNRVVQLVESENQWVYWQVTRGTAPRKHAFPAAQPNLWIMIRPYTLPDLTRRFALITYKDLRFEYCNIKTINLLPSVLATEAAVKAGCDEAVFFREGGIVTECAHSNVSIIKDGILYTHPADRFILNGIARRHILTHARTLHIPIREETFTLDALASADEILISNSGTFCAAASQLDGKTVGGKNPDVVAQLQKLILDEFYTFVSE